MHLLFLEPEALRQENPISDRFMCIELPIAYNLKSMRVANPVLAWQRSLSH